ncbi:hypothetical protein [Bordetella parapertussis]|uniref:hypothetical protein n=1 Tax=Bordetella parapertussis TaxID=519 RepID=UPI000E12D1D3|nr:hypothetical protein [Bordetella parapertussis]SUV73767.1 Uncharacterised protein [Bordetella parapertussis]
MRRNRFLAPLLVAASLLATAPAHGQPAPAAVLASDEAQRIALDAYVYVYPLVVMDLSRRQDTGGKGPGHAPPTPSRTSAACRRPTSAACRGPTSTCCVRRPGWTCRPARW